MVFVCLFRLEQRDITEALLVGEKLASVADWRDAGMK
jgi:hypothetical protein